MRGFLPADWFVCQLDLGTTPSNKARITLHFPDMNKFSESRL
jgi:hypothetical protein